MPPMEALPELLNLLQMIRKPQQREQARWKQQQSQNRLQGPGACGALPLRRPSRAWERRLQWNQSLWSMLSHHSLKRRPAGVHPWLAVASACQLSRAPSRFGTVTLQDA